MKRILCAALLGAAALATPAAADPLGNTAIGVRPVVHNDGNRVGVGAEYNVGHGWQPFGGAYVDQAQGEACVGFSYQVPQCVPTRFEVD